MVSTNGLRARLLARLAAPLLLAAGLSACSSIPDWVDPTTWIGGDSQPSADQQPADQASTDQGNAEASAGQTPDIAAVPPKPTPPSTSDEQKQVTDSLAADRAEAHYSADALRGGTEAAAPPPPAEAPAATPSADQGAAAPDQTAADNQSQAAAAPPSSTAAAPATPASSGADTEASAPPPASSASGTEVASTDNAAAAGPAAAPVTAEAAAAAAAPSSGSLQASFEPSRAPALDPSVSQFVPQPILLHYRQTAAAAASPGLSSASDPQDPPTPVKHRHKKKTSDVSRPVHMAAAEDSTGAFKYSGNALLS